MDNRGHIDTKENFEKMYEARGLTPAQKQIKMDQLAGVPPEQVAALKAMSRKDRRAWYAKARRAARAGNTITKGAT